MIDFAKKVEELKAWKIRRAQVKCVCNSFNPINCYAWARDIESDNATPCKCKCHVA